MKQFTEAECLEICGLLEISEEEYYTAKEVLYMIQRLKEENLRLSRKIGIALNFPANAEVYNPNLSRFGELYRDGWRRGVDSLKDRMVD